MSNRRFVNLPGGPEGRAVEVEKPCIEGEEHGAGERQLLTPVRHGIGGQDQGILDLLHQLVRDLLGVESVGCHTKTSRFQAGC